MLSELMPRYFFHIRSPEEFIRDEEGIELADLDRVRWEAVEGAKGLLKQAIDQDRTLDHQEFEVADEAGRIVLTYPFRDAIKIA
jgi:hypothetical protein